MKLRIDAQELTVASNTERRSGLKGPLFCFGTILAFGFVSISNRRRKVREMLKGWEFRIYLGRNRDSRRFARQLDSVLEEPSGWILSDLLDSDEGTASRLKCAEALSQRFVHLTLPLHLCITRVG